jgi:4-amino-4-deoxy-L-arabinose transferase-like glycosyltransferase
MLPFLFFSYSTAKLPGYILPIFPPLILLAATEWVRIWDGQKTLIPWILTSITALIFTVATISAFHQSFGGLREGVYLSSPFLIVAIAGLVAALKNKIKLAFVAMASSIVLTILLIVVIAFPLIGGHFSTKTIVEDAKPFISKDKPLILYRYFDLTAHYYSNYSTTRGEVYNPENLADYIVKNKQDQYFLLTNDQGLGEIKEKYEPVIISHRHIFYLVRISHPGLNND